MGFLNIFTGLLNILLVICSIFMICLVLIQRGKGGGLAGAFGGVGGSSAFGTKAGDIFTRITIGTAGVWFVLAMLLVVANNQGRTSALAFEAGGTAKSARQVPIDTGAGPKGQAAPTRLGGGTPSVPAVPSGTAAPAKTNPDLPAALEDEGPAPATPGTPASKPSAPAERP